MEGAADFYALLEDLSANVAVMRFVGRFRFRKIAALLGRPKGTVSAA